MPVYKFQNPYTKEIVEVFQHMNDIHSYVQDGINWSRIYTVPMAAVGTKIDPFSTQQFIEQSYQKKGTIGNLFDQSKELSAKREKILGIDPFKQKYLENWSKKRKGKTHPDLLKKQTQEFVVE